MIVHLTTKSSNKKTGPIPVSTTEEKSCPTSCPWHNKGCYAKYGPLKMHWQKVSAQERGTNWKEFLYKIAELPDNQMWRHNQAGDLPGTNQNIDSVKLKALVKANKGKQGFTYTHKPVEGRSKQAKKNRALVRWANSKGFVVNLSGNSIAHADRLMKVRCGPVTTVIDSNIVEKSFVSPGGNKVTVCPAAYRKDISCATCKMCAFHDRKTIIAFPIHGTGARAMNEKLKVIG